jgi:hypothetical protein
VRQTFFILYLFLNTKHTHLMIIKVRKTYLDRLPTTTFGFSKPYPLSYIISRKNKATQSSHFLFIKLANHQMTSKFTSTALVLLFFLTNLKFNFPSWLYCSSYTVTLTSANLTIWLSCASLFQICLAKAIHKFY